MPVVLIENFRAIFYAPFYAACSIGAYVAEGLEVELKYAAELGKALEAVTAGAGQVSWGGPLRILAALDQDPACGYAAFCEVVGRDPFFLVGRTRTPASRPRSCPSGRSQRSLRSPPRGSACSTICAMPCSAPAQSGPGSPMRTASTHGSQNRSCARIRRPAARDSRLSPGLITHHPSLITATAGGIGRGLARYFMEVRV